MDASPRLYSSTAKDDFSTEPFHFHKGFEWKGKFYAATIDGVWRLDATGSTWTKLPDVPKLLQQSVNPVCLYGGLRRALRQHSQGLAESRQLVQKF